MAISGNVWLKEHDFLVFFTNAKVKMNIQQHAGEYRETFTSEFQNLVQILHGIFQ